MPSLLEGELACGWRGWFRVTLDLVMGMAVAAPGVVLASEETSACLHVYGTSALVEIPMFYVLAWLGISCRAKAAIAAGIISYLSSMSSLAAEIVGGGPSESALSVSLSLFTQVVIFGAVTISGVVVRQARVYAQEAREHEAEERAKRAVGEERLRMAQEMHDILGHGIALIAVQAELTASTMSARPERAGPALRSIAALSRGHARPPVLAGRPPCREAVGRQAARAR